MPESIKQREQMFTYTISGADVYLIRSALEQELRWFSKYDSGNQLVEFQRMAEKYRKLVEMFTI